MNSDTNQISTAQIRSLANEVFGDPVKVANWFASPVDALGRQTPESLLGDEQGRMDVHAVLIRIGDGVFS